jgi:hypothetical protein
MLSIRTLESVTVSLVLLFMGGIDVAAASKIMEARSATTQLTMRAGAAVDNSISTQFRHSAGFRNPMGHNHTRNGERSRNKPHCLSAGLAHVSSFRYRPTSHE